MKQFTKPALSFEEQLNLLAARGLKIENRDWAKGHLRRIGYYRLSAYALPLQYNDPIRLPQHLFKPGSSFGLIIRLYEFDRHLRLLVLDAIERLEVAVRGCISSTLCLTHKNPHWFMDAAHFRAPVYQTELLAKLDEEFGRNLPRPKPRGDVFIRHYYATYRSPAYPPSWMLAEALSLGAWSKIYQQLTTANQKLIAQFHGQKYDTVENWLRVLSDIRNICAHHGRLWNRAFVALPSFPTNLIRYPLDTARFAAQAAVIVSMLRHFYPDTRWMQRVATLMDAYPEADPAAMGFPPSWKHDPLWDLPPPESDPVYSI
jgi:abortive infection bacteriophage resistance protein